MTAQALPLRVLLQRLAADHGISVVVEERYDESPITVAVQDVPVDDLLAALARRIGCTVSRVGETYYLGAILPQDRAVMVRRVTGMDAMTAKEVLGVYTSEYGRLAITPQGVAVAGDRMEVISRMSAMLDQVEAVRVDSWMVQLYVFSMSENYTRDLGIEGATTIDLAGTLTSAGAASGLASAALKALVRASFQSDSIRLATSPLFVLVEGQTAELDDGQTIPIPKRAVSDQGTVTTTGYELIQTGLTVKVSVRPAADGLGLLTLDYSSNQISRYVESAPVTDGVAIRTTSQVEPDGVYLLGEVRHRNRHSTDEAGMTLRTRGEASDRLWQVWARVVRISGIRGQ